MAPRLPRSPCNSRSTIDGGNFFLGGGLLGGILNSDSFLGGSVLGFSILVGFFADVLKFELQKLNVMKKTDLITITQTKVESKTDFGMGFQNCLKFL